MDARHKAGHDGGWKSSELVLREIVDLDAAQRATLIEEVAAASRFVQSLPGVEKINVGALGDIVAQLHVHVVGRAVGDAAWPGPVWGHGSARRYAPEKAAALVAQARAALATS